MPRISVFLPSFNKRGFGVEAARSVLDQDFTDWELWIMENSTDVKTREVLKKYLPMDDPRIIYEDINLSEGTRAQHWPAPYLNNMYYPLANGDIIMYISDDDLFMPGLFSAVVDYFDEHPARSALYFHLVRTRAFRPGEGTHWDDAIGGIAADFTRNDNEVDCCIDGGQIAYRKKVLDAFEDRPYFYDGNGGQASHADGLHMADVARAGFLFYPLDVPGVIHRHTPFSTWTT